MPLQIRRGTEAERQSAVSLIPQTGELVWITDDQKLYIGDGTTELKSLTPISGYNDEDAADHIGAVLQAGPHTGLSFNYVDAAGTISATISPTQNLTTLTVTGTTTLGTTNISGNLVVDGLLTADYKGSIFADDSTTLVDALSGVINLDDTIDTNLIPKQDAVYDLGSPSRKFKDAYLSGSSLWLGNAQITSNGTGINLPAGSTINGGPIGGAGTGQSLNVDIVGDDSTIIVNSSTNTVTGTFDGDLNGSVFGDDSTVLVDGVSNTVKLNNGTIDITDSTITSTDFTVTVSNEDDAINTRLVINNKDNTSAALIRTIGGASPTDPSSYTIRSYFGGFQGSGSETKASAGDYIGSFQAQTFDPALGGVNVPSAAVIFKVDDNNSPIADGQAKGKIELGTNAGTASSPSYNYLTFDSQGQLAVNQQTASATLDVNGFMKLAAITAEPSPKSEGMIALADGATWDPSGSNPTKKQLVIYLGTTWVQLAIQP